MQENSRAGCQKNTTRHGPETRRPDTPEGIEAARRKWETRLRREGNPPSESRRVATTREVRRRIKESGQRVLKEREREEEEHLRWVAETEAVRRRDFKPHAFILTARQPANWISGLAHGDACRIRFKEGTEPESFRDQVLRALPDAVEPWGKVVGFEVHYSPDHAVRYGRDGRETAG